jgi:hypothetical protein
MAAVLYDAVRFIGRLVQTTYVFRDSRVLFHGDLEDHVIGYLGDFITSFLHEICSYNPQYVS